MQDATAVDGLTVVVLQVVVVQLLAPEAAAAVHEATGTSVVVSGVGQVVVVQWLPLLGPDATQVPTGTLV